MSIGPSEFVVILLAVFLLFGSRRLADLGKGIGDGIRGFKRGIAGETESEPVEEKQSEPPGRLAGRVATPSGLGETSAQEPSTHAGAVPAAAPAASENVTVTPTDSATSARQSQQQ